MTQVSLPTAARFVAMNIADFDTAGHSRCYSQRRHRWGFVRALFVTSMTALALAFAAAFALPLIGSY